MARFLIKGARIVNEGSIRDEDILLNNGRIEKMAPAINPKPPFTEINAAGLHLFPGVIDDQVHFREPGLTHKADIHSESRAAIAGGVTSFMEMPNTQPPTLSQHLLEEKYKRASEVSLANYSFYMGAANDNYDEVMKTDLKNVCGLKVFMGSSTGNMLVDNEQTLERLFSNFPGLIAAHCEDETTIRKNSEEMRKKYGEEVPMKYHPEIRSEEACWLSSSKAAELAKKHGARLHILHISTARELQLLGNGIPLQQKKITAEACIHHLWFSARDYEREGKFIKWNPAIKSSSDRDALFNAVLNDTIDVVATDHAPHTLEEKQRPYFQSPSGGPLVQHSLVVMLEFHHQQKISLEKIAQKMAHHPAMLFRIRDRGFIREGCWADVVLVDLNSPWEVSRENILYKCGWSPFEGQIFHSRVTHTFVNGHLVYERGKLSEGVTGKRLEFITEPGG
ncbi:MAG TPA: dihydroorotase [Chitinophagales bacterium]|nr:dihydroorotase [Chitinophagales bacterium]